MCVDCTAWYTDCTFPLTGKRGEGLGGWMIAEGRDSWFLSRSVRSVWWSCLVGWCGMVWGRNASRDGFGFAGIHGPVEEKELVII